MKSSVDNALATVLWFMYGHEQWGHNAALTHWELIKRIRNRSKDNE